MATPQDQFPMYCTLESALEISETAAKLVRLKFNVSGDEDVTRLKTLAAAFITHCQKMRAREPRSFAKAITDMQSASMFAVHGATSKL